MKQLLLLIFVLVSVTGCKKDTAPATRSFYMGVTTWPADFTTEEFNNTYGFINSDCDLVSHHFDEGIPYEEAYTNSGWPQGLLDDLDVRRSKIDPGKKVLLSSSVLDLTRKARAPYSKFSENISAAVKNEWNQLPFNDPKVVTAYSNFIIYLVNTLHPAYINYGVESNEGSWNNADFLIYKDFLSKVFINLKAAFPGIPVMASFMVTESPQALAYAAQLVPYTDYIALSAYPYTHVSSSASGNTDPGLFPADFFTRFLDLDPSKPCCFAETGYIAEPLLVPAFNLNKQGTPAWQNAYLEKLCELMNTRNGKFIIWFCNKDYDAGNNTLRNLGLYQDLFALWEDTGLTDEQNNHRPAFNTWQGWMSRKKID